jgi:hypothetical protein
MNIPWTPSLVAKGLASAEQFPGRRRITWNRARGVEVHGAVETLRVTGGRAALEDGVVDEK